MLFKRHANHSAAHVARIHRGACGSQGPARLEGRTGCLVRRSDPGDLGAFAGESTERGENLAKKICGQPPQALRMTKKLMREGTMANFSTIMEMSAALQVTLHQTEDHKEALNAFFEKRSPQFVGR